MKRIVTVCLMFFLYLSFSMNNAIDFLMNTEDNSSRESSSDEDDHNLVMFSPTEKANAETDMESHACDDNEWWSCTPCAKELINSTCDSSLFDKEN